MTTMYEFVSEEHYTSLYWVDINQAVISLLNTPRNERTSISFEKIFSHVYKCIAHGERLLEDIKMTISEHLNSQYLKLNMANDAAYIQTFHDVLKQYLHAVAGITAVCNPLDRFRFRVSNMNGDMRNEFLGLFRQIVLEPHTVRLSGRLSELMRRPLEEVSPDVMQDFVKNLYAIKQDLVCCIPDVFQRYVTECLPRTAVDDIPALVRETDRLQRSLELQGFDRALRPGKRTSEEMEGGCDRMETL